MQLQSNTVMKQQDSNIVELADAHCHLDIFENFNVIKQSINRGVKIIIGNGIDTPSNMKAVELSDNINIFATMGVDPENAIIMGDDELEFNIKLIRENKNRIVGIGEVGLDNKIALNNDQKNRQLYVFNRMLDLALELDLPVSIHSRGAFDEVISALTNKKVKRVHMHFFEGDENQAKVLADNNFFMSVPPVETSKRKRAINAMPLSNIMTETDSPVVGKSPMDVSISLGMIANTKKIDYNEAAIVIMNNTKAFFNISNKLKGYKQIR